MPEEDLVDVKFRLYDGSDIGPFRYSSASTVEMLKARIVSEWPKGKTIVPKVVNEIKLISFGKILENNKTIGQCRAPFGELAGGVMVMHVVVQPSLAKSKTEKMEDSRKCACSCCIMFRGSLRSAISEAVQCDHRAAAMAPERGGKVTATPAKKKIKAINPLFEKRPKQFGIGGALPPRRDMHWFVKWPKVVQIQRKKRILKQRLKVPPALNQFTKTLDKNLATSLFKMLLKYRPKDKAAKKERLLKKAQAEAEGKDVGTAKKPIVMKYGLNHVSYLIEQFTE
ncbi:hypothetical protein Nepgr_018561 [Nepenthes gracilis]|uniref:60S ribosomal protein L7a n=1 Tax=Nepenthes gracilis TaxID=150966 RepID=A0AAD3STJ0_NEPGR|nr:hypothetical protein Nepgr_018561 [Nepenthes gracilis]